MLCWIWFDVWNKVKKKLHEFTWMVWVSFILCCPTCGSWTTDRHVRLLLRFHWCSRGSSSPAILTASRVCASLQMLLLTVLSATKTKHKIRSWKTNTQWQNGCFVQSYPTKAKAECHDVSCLWRHPLWFLLTLISVNQWLPLWGYIQPLYCC